MIGEKFQVPHRRLIHTELRAFVSVQTSSGDPPAVFEASFLQQEEVKIRLLLISGIEPDIAGIPHDPALMIADRKAQADAVSARVDLTLETDCHA